MADPRKSVAFALETGQFGSGEVDTNDQDQGIFYALPPGTWCSHSNEFKTEPIYATGSKLRETAAYGPFSGSWSIHFIMDYEHTEFLDLFFDKHQVSAAVENVYTDLGSPVYDHTWVKDNSTFIPHFVIREKQLNRIANSANENAKDEVILLKGCIARSIEFTRSQQGSQMNVTITGLFSDMEVQLAELTATDYTAYDNSVGATQYSCMFMDSQASDNYVRDVDSHAIKVELDSSLVYNTCTPFATTYLEGQTTITWDAKTFANDPEKKFQLRPFSGGKDSVHLKPMAKSLMPMENAYFFTYNLSMRDDGIDNIADAITMSPYRVMFNVQDSTVNAMSWPDGEGEKITDTLQSVQCSRLVVSVRNTHSTTDWHNTISNGGTGVAYDPVAIGSKNGKLRPSITSEDGDLGGSSGTSVTVDMAEGAYILVSSSDMTRAKGALTFAKSAAISAHNTLENWYIIPYDTSLYDPGTDEPTTLQELLGLTNTQVTELAAPGVTAAVDWQTVTEVQTTVGSENPVDSSVLRYVPVTTLTGTPTTKGTYKYYILKAHVTPVVMNSENTQVVTPMQLVIEDRGILRIDVVDALAVEEEL